MGLVAVSGSWPLDFQAFLYHKEAFGDSGAACDDIGFLGSPASSAFNVVGLAR